MAILVVPELVPPGDGSPYPKDAAWLRRRLSRTNRRLRVIVTVADKQDLEFATAFVGDNPNDVHVLLARDLAPDVRLTCKLTYLPIGCPAEPELVETGLAFTDAMVICPGCHEAKAAKRARELGKIVFEPEDQLPCVDAPEDVTAGLDLENPKRCTRFLLGRFSSTPIEVLGLRPFTDRLPQTGARLFKILRGVIGGRSLDPAFAPEPPRDPDGGAPIASISKALEDSFVIMDRSGVHASYKYRDGITATHMLGVMAVMAAVTGVAYPGYLEQALISELAILLALALVVMLLWYSNIHDRWMACRMAAEELRIAMICLPLLVVPPALVSKDSTPDPLNARADESSGLNFAALSDVKRRIRDDGPPELEPAALGGPHLTFLRERVEDQLKWHEAACDTLERFEDSLRTCTQAIFLFVVTAVVYEVLYHEYRPILPHCDWLPLITAGGPAIVAGLHGWANRLGVNHRILHSKLAVRDLRPIRKALHDIEGATDTFVGTSEKVEKDWLKVRGLAFRAAEVMGRQNASWQGLVRLRHESLLS